MKRAKTVDAYIEDAEHWQAELENLRQILRSTDLIEEVKWGAPCYTYDGRNVVGVGAFKSYFGLWFFQGALLEDKDNVLINAQEGKTKALRQWRMCSAEDIKPAVIRRYVKEAIALAKAGQEIKPARARKLAVSGELRRALHANKKAGDAFNKLTPGRQREYADYVAEAKRADTKQRRLDRILPMIARGVGLNDKYR